MHASCYRFTLVGLLLGLFIIGAQAQPSPNVFWESLGDGLNNTVRALAVDTADGTLYTGGDFDMAGGVAANRIAQWDGMAWSPLGSGVNQPVRSLVVASNGDLYAGCDFDTAGGVEANRVALWDGNTWSPLADGVNGTAFTLVLDEDQNLYLGGGNEATGNASGIAKWNGIEWTGELATNDVVYAQVFKDSDNSDPDTLYAGGDFTFFDDLNDNPGAQPGNRILQWDGSAWSPLGSGTNNTVRALVIGTDNNLYAAGDFTTAGGNAANRVAMWDGSTWSPLGSGMNNTVRALVIGADDTLYAAGDFTTAGGNAASRIAKWDGSQWSPLGSGVDGQVFALAMGSVYVGGDFSNAGAGSASNVARWIGDEASLPVELVQFTATLDGSDALLAWQTASETDNAGFEVLRNSESVGWIDGHGTTTEARTYTYRVPTAAPGTHRFRLKQIDLDGTAHYSAEVEVAVDLDGRYVIEATYPNPFHSEARLAFTLNTTETVRAEVYNALGQRMAVVYNGMAEAGIRQDIQLNGRNWPSGLYLLHLTGETFSATRRITLVR